LNKILIFIDWYLPGYKAGGPISSIVNLVDHLSGEFEFMIITRDTDYCENTPYPQVNSDTWNTLQGKYKVYYISGKKLTIKSLIQITKNLEFNLVYINGIYSLYFSIFPLVWFHWVKKKTVIISSRGMLSEHTFSSKKIKKKLFYFIARYSGLYKGVIFQATNRHEADQIRHTIGFKGDIKVVPNLPAKKTISGLLPAKKDKGDLRLVNIARISPEKNILFALEVLEKISFKSVNSVNTAPGKISLDIYGTIYNEIYWKRCEEVIARLPDHIKINYCGLVEKSEITLTLTRYHFFIMPSQGENYGHSIVESFLAGCPVIISDRTPWHNLEEAGWDIPLEQPDKFREIIEYCVWMDQERFDEMRRGTLMYGMKIYNDKDIIQANRDMLKGDVG
jgi:glycosyltransferase involved in cell wall biosynthesis